MNREEAYNRIDAIIAKHEIDDEYVTITSALDYDALRFARKLLEQEPCEDVISREDALLCLTGEYLENYAYDELIAKFARRIKALPSSQPDIEAIRQMRPATPEERQGEKEYIDSISDPTGVNFNDLLKHDEEEWIDECFDKLYNAPTVEDKPQGEEKNICDSCRNKACIFDSHVKRQKCDFYKPQTEWIPVSEKLPEEGKEVLTCSNGGFIEIQSFEDSCADIYWENQNGDWTDIDEVIAWMPLPKPYKAESEE